MVFGQVCCCFYSPSAPTSAPPSAASAPPATSASVASMGLPGHNSAPGSGIHSTGTGASTWGASATAGIRRAEKRFPSKNDCAIWNFPKA